MAVYLRWPEKLPLPLLSGHSITPGNPLIETKLDSGYSRVRRKHKNVPSTMAAGWLFTSEELSLFNGFLEHALDAGANQFVMPVLLPEGLIDHVVRFKPPLKQEKPLSKKLWRKDAVLLIERRFVPSQDEVLEYYFDPLTTSTAITDIENTIKELGA